MFSKPKEFENTCLGVSLSCIHERCYEVNLATNLDLAGGIFDRGVAI